ncbi:MAG: hypothetical protein JNM24_12485 [Bdellovibrionaceae bacterium]|jgi:hypothetical protein|nr:hypothetical protein [Pseudobdellovibrionaceae bacterium]
MKFISAVAVFLVSICALSQTPQQIVIAVDREDFRPLQEVSWKILAGTSSMSTTDGSINRSGNGLGVGIERMLTSKWSIGAHYTNIRTFSSDSDIAIYDLEGNPRPFEYRESINMVDVYGRYSFVNYPVNKWNLIQVGLLAGLMGMDRHTRGTQPIYGASASYNYDNMLGFELNTKVNIDAEASTSANLIGYF